MIVFYHPFHEPVQNQKEPCDKRQSNAGRMIVQYIHITEIANRKGHDT
jgi:hypothetical protein